MFLTRARALPALILALLLLALAEYTPLDQHPIGAPATELATYGKGRRAIHNAPGSPDTPDTYGKG